MEQRLTLFTLGVDDLEKMNNFYQDVFGWQPVDSSTDDIVFYHLNGIQLALFGKKALAEDAGISAEGSGFRGFSFAHNLRSEEEVDALFKSLKSQEVHIVKEPESTAWGGYSGYFTDPEDNLWEVAFNPFMELNEDGSVVKPHSEY